MKHPSKARNRWVPYLAFLHRVHHGDFSFDVNGVARDREWIQ
jgi:hypothetical protein